MAANQSIQPFPDSIERDAFGHYLSGFTDGEGCFVLKRVNRYKKTIHTPTACFTIHLRADDADILTLIQSFLGCGALSYVRRTPTSPRHKRPECVYHAQSLGDLTGRIIPNFDRYPLRAKKARDYAIWREGVLFLQNVTAIRRIYLGYRQGSIARWTEERLAHFDSLSASLKATRLYDREPLPPPVRRQQGSLFDNLDA